MNGDNSTDDSKTLARIETALDKLNKYVHDQEKAYTRRFQTLENSQFKCQLAVDHRISDVEKFVAREEKSAEKAPALWTGFVSAGAVCIGVLIQLFIWWFHG